MKVMQKKQLIIGLILISSTLLLQACGRNIDPEPSCNFVQNSKLQRVSWKNKSAKMYIHSSVPTKYHQTIRNAAKKWNDELGYTVISIEASVGGTSLPSKDGYNIIYWLTDWDSEKKSEQARTTIYWTGSKIYEADIRINAKNHKFSTTPETLNGHVDFYSLLVHEMGHVLGLAHVPQEKQSVMQAYLANGVERRKLTEVDQSSLKCEYG
ncbi:MAG: matrixin family metalloprotease, partial [Bdellovibrionales bacterium]|nr:matrixin family metalloprotease [Bdellovibrionales bacterium]